MDARTISPARLSIGLVGAPTAWIVQGLLGWFFGARICAAASIATVRTSTGIIGILALALALVSLSISVGNASLARQAGWPSDDRTEFLAFGGVFVSAVFVIGVAWAGLNALFVNVCGAMR